MNMNFNFTIQQILFLEVDLITTGNQELPGKKVFINFQWKIYQSEWLS